jgi:RepB DNA-primase from phage plasmid
MHEPDAKQALAMLAAFESVGARSFEVTFTDIKGDKTGYQPYRSVEDLRRTITKALHAANQVQQNYIIRPRLKQPQLVQLDDLDMIKAGRLSSHAFMVLQTSPGNFQAWLAVSDGPNDKTGKEDLARRLRKGAGVDKYASGATRISGSVNFKTKYAPEFPLVTLSQVNAGHVATIAELDAAGIVAPKDEPLQPRSAAHRNLSAGRPTQKKWPSYQMCLDGAPLNQNKTGPDTSLADFTWCRTAIEWGWGVEATATRLHELSAKAKEWKPYAMLTATKAAESVERQPYRLKPTPRPSW